LFTSGAVDPNGQLFFLIPLAAVAIVLVTPSGLSTSDQAQNIGYVAGGAAVVRYGPAVIRQACINGMRHRQAQIVRQILQLERRQAALNSERMALEAEMNAARIAGNREAFFRAGAARDQILAELRNVIAGLSRWRALFQMFQNMIVRCGG